MITFFSEHDVPETGMVGGKARELIRMTAEGFPVPPGFVLGTGFFAPWIEELEASPEWRALLEGGEPAMRKAAKELKARCGTFALKSSLSHILQESLSRLRGDRTGMRFAVRSSSPEEDLNKDSFAGGYETVLGVAEEGLEVAVRRCFASCLDERVFLYRARMGLPQAAPKIAVIVQELIDADTAGVAFSINPVNNCYDEAVINANRGLGESVVSGGVEPDTFVVDKVSGGMIEERIGSKEYLLASAAEGGVERRIRRGENSACLTGEGVAEVVRLLMSVEASRGEPVDIEWAFSGGKLHLLQVRPITVYFALPEEMLTPPGAKRLLYANSTLIEQGIEGTLSVLGADFMTHVLRSMARVFGGDATGMDGTIFTAGGRYYMNLSYSLLMGGKKAAFAPGSIGDETVTSILEGIDLAQYLPAKLPRKLAEIRRRMPLSVIRLLVPIARAYLRPERFIEAFAHALPDQERKFQVLEKEGSSLEGRAAYLSGLLDFFNIEYGVPLVLAAQFAHARLRRLFDKRDPRIRDHLAGISACLPGNKTAEMGSRMCELASMDEIASCNEAEAFLEMLEGGRCSPLFRERWNGFLREYGMRRPREIDAAEPRYSEDPRPLFDSLKGIASGLSGTDGGTGFFQRAATRRDAACAALSKEAARMGPRKLRSFERNYRVWAALGGYREMPKHYIIKATDAFRRSALEKAAGLAASGRLESPEQVFDLRIADVDRAESDPSLDLRALAAERSAFGRKASGCRMAVRMIDSRGKVFHPAGPDRKDGVLSGAPISPGLARGKVKVIRDPSGQRLLPGEILVARATDPGWTPLFINAAGIVLEIGGVLQHGAIVAREYGIPCVSGVVNATEILADGRMVEVDGSAGTVRLLD